MMSKKEMKELLEKHEKAMDVLRNACDLMKQTNDTMINKTKPRLDKQINTLENIKKNLTISNEKIKEFFLGLEPKKKEIDANDLNLL